MIYNCCVLGCFEQFKGPDEPEQVQAIAEMQSELVVNGPDGPEFFCRNHRAAGATRFHAADSSKNKSIPAVPNPEAPPVEAPPPIPKIEGEEKAKRELAEAAANMPPGEVEMMIPPETMQGHVWITVQRDRVLGIFTNQWAADNIRKMVGSLSPEIVVVQEWEMDIPSVQLIEEVDEPEAVPAEEEEHVEVRNEEVVPEESREEVVDAEQESTDTEAAKEKGMLSG